MQIIFDSFVLKKGFNFFFFDMQFKTGWQKVIGWKDGIVMYSAVKWWKLETIFYICPFSKEVRKDLAAIKLLMESEYTSKWDQIVDFISAGSQKKKKSRLFFTRSVFQTTIHFL